MALTSRDIIPLSQVRGRLTELCDEVRGGAEKIFTRNGESYVALIDVRRLDHFRRLERSHIHLLLLEEAAAGLGDVEAGRTSTVEDLKKHYGR